jgi:hypothetical protein
MYLFRRHVVQSVPELTYIQLTANVNIYSEMDSAKKIVKILLFLSYNDFNLTNHRRQILIQFSVS